MELWQHTFDELTKGLAVEPCAVLQPEIPMPFNNGTITPLKSHPGYATADAEGHTKGADQVLLKKEGSEWRCVGHFIGNTIIVFGGEGRAGLGTELFLRCVKFRKAPLTTLFSASGFKFLRKVHKETVRRALKEGLNVPAFVIAEYPNLKAAPLSTTKSSSEYDA
jgi:hypothetical protein